MRSPQDIAGLISTSVGGRLPAATAGTMDASAAAAERWVQRIEFEVNDGYRPTRRTAPAGSPLRIAFHRLDADRCTERVVFSSPRVERRLAPRSTTVVDLPAQPPGVVRFTCGMGRYRGEIELVEVEPSPAPVLPLAALGSLVAVYAVFLAAAMGFVRTPFVVDVNPVIASLGGIALRWYSLTLLASALVAYAVFARESRRLDLAPWVVTDGVWRVAIAALVGGRILFEIQNDLPMVAASPIHLLMVWEGGLSFYGGLIAGLAVIVVLAVRRGLPIWRVLDAAAPAAALGQAIGHIGCLITGDSYGLPTTLPWAVVYRNPAAVAPQNVPLQPTQVYEAFALALLFAALWLGRRRLASVGPGAVAGMYLVGIAAIRFALFFLRDEHGVFFGLKTAQLIGLGLASAGAAILVRLVRTHTAFGLTDTEWTPP